MSSGASILDALHLILNLNVFLYLLFGTIIGVFCGAMPGLTAVGAIAILLPITFYMSPIDAIVFLCAIYVSAVYGGSITAILINAPGTPAGTCTSLDGFPLTRKGKASKALGISIWGSALGGIFSYICLFFFMNPLANFALKFGPSEMFMVAVFGLSIVSSLQGKNFVKGLLAALVGILIGTVGISSTGSMRGCFTISYLMDGVPFVPAMMGLFAFSSLFELLFSSQIVSEKNQTQSSVREMLSQIKFVLSRPLNFLRSSVIGTIIGAIPAAGGSLAAFISYNEEKRFAKNPDEYGQGKPEGVLASEAANNASTGGALLTMLAIGLPGDASTGLMMGALMMHGLRPGPRLFMEQGSFVYGIIFALFLSQVFMILIGILYSRAFSNITFIKTSILIPIVAVICVVGSYSIRFTFFDAWLMILFGIIGYFMKKHGYPALALVLGLILGPIADTELCKTFILFNGDLSVLFTRPINIVLLALTLFSIIFSLRKKRPEKAKIK